VVFLRGFHLLDFARHVFVRGYQIAQFHKSADDEYVHLHGAFAVEHRGEHGHAVLGEGQRGVFRIAAAAVLSIF
jgi:hypothetical protein